MALENKTLRQHLMREIVLEHRTTEKQSARKEQTQKSAVNGIYGLP